MPRAIIIALVVPSGSRVEGANNFHVSIQVGKEGNVGIAEIQDLLFTVKGGTAGATKNCPKNSGTISKSCMSAALMLRLTRSSSAYLKNVWIWTADHDLDIVTQDQIDVYTARGYKLYQARNLVMGMIQKKSPYYQPVPPAPEPFAPGTNLCQDMAFKIEESLDVWIYNLVTKAIQEMVSLIGDLPTLASDNNNAFLSSLLAWVRGPEAIIGQRILPATISGMRWFDNVASTCAGYNVTGSAATKYGDVIAAFTEVDYTKEHPKEELCSFCFVQRLEVMQQSSYSVYDEYFQADLETVYAECGLSGLADPPPSLDSPPQFPPEPICVSGQIHVTSEGHTCDSIALKYGVSSAALVMSNSRYLISCNNLNPDMELCLPETCASVYTMQTNDTCRSIERTNSYLSGTVRKYNSWVSWDCSNLQSSTDVYGHVLCIGVQGGTFTATAPIPGVTLSPGTSTGYADTVVDPPSNATVAEATTLKCGRWHVAVSDETCAMICVQERLTSTLFMKVNPSLSSNDCSASLVPGYAYCVGPTSGWDADLSRQYPLP
ncbi:hypothetical protein BJX65DRAFT_298093 [Aspergillus insuetus]